MNVLSSMKYNGNDYDVESKKERKLLIMNGRVWGIDLGEEILEDPYYEEETDY